ncbi:hypothetical protein KUTeg_016843 [Tegillarca granosa]|uniref:Uncharacterized protein n=1 Tax=Tegillarca granosa TaxID=220873 RepID=A0ABQ9ESP7_TEGGR|nr:hypothetical protein KUTeg_016843 [Tegillarca granosa]
MHVNECYLSSDYNNRKSSLPKRRDSAKSSPLLGIGCSKRVRSHSHSLEVSTHKFYEQSRRTKSYEDIVDYDVLKITEFKGPFYNTDFDVISELGSPTGSKVRYNDTGSIEQLNDDNLDRLSLYDTYEDFEVDMENDDTETLNGTQKYRELWNLRTTFEEEEECSDTIRMEDTITSPDQSPDENSNYSDHVSYNNNNTGGNNRTERKRIHNHQSHNQIQIGSNTLHPHFENRRQTYQNILTKRLQRAKQNTSTENSFDSVETVDTDGDVSDTSRHEVTTTSFETSTDNTDSTTESQNHRLMQMKADSGYKSLENQPPIVQPPGAVKRNHSAGEIEEYDSFFQEPGPSGEHFYTRSKNFDRRNGKTASKKRREYSRERQAVQIYESINEPETDSRSDQPSGDSFEETPQPSKISVFSRLFKSQKGSTKQRSNTRDYSIDEKTDKLFREFVRYDPKFEHRSNTSPHRSPRFQRHRLHRKHTEPMYFEERRRDRLAPELRTTSLGSDSSASSARRISPQDSIEEEDYEEVREAEELEPSIIQRDLTSRQSLSVHDIPVIKLPEEEASAGF